MEYAFSRKWICRSWSFVRHKADGYSDYFVLKMQSLYYLVITTIVRNTTTYRNHCFLFSCFYLCKHIFYRTRCMWQ